MGVRASFPERTLKIPKDPRALRPTIRSSYRDGFNLVAQGVPDATILDNLRITQKALLKLKAAYVALFPDKAAHVLKVANTGLRYLVDECISPICVLGVAERYG